MTILNISDYKDEKENIYYEKLKKYYPHELILKAAFDKEKVPDSRSCYFLQLNAEKVAAIVKASYDAIHALPKDEEDAKWV